MYNTLRKNIAQLLCGAEKFRMFRVTPVHYITLLFSRVSKQQEEPLRNWSLTLTVDGKDSASYTFQNSFVLPAGEIVKVWARFLPKN